MRRARARLARRPGARELVWRWRFDFDRRFKIGFLGSWDDRHARRRLGDGFQHRSGAGDVEIRGRVQIDFVVHAVAADMDSRETAVGEAMNSMTVSAMRSSSPKIDFLLMNRFAVKEVPFRELKSRMKRLPLSSKMTAWRGRRLRWGSDIAAGLAADKQDFGIDGNDGVHTAYGDGGRGRAAGRVKPPGGPGT